MAESIEAVLARIETQMDAMRRNYSRLLDDLERKENKHSEQHDKIIEQLNEHENNFSRLEPLFERISTHLDNDIPAEYVIMRKIVVCFKTFSALVFGAIIPLLIKFLFDIFREGKP